MLVDTTVVQVASYMRTLQKPVSGIGKEPIAIRGSATTLANATDFAAEMSDLGLTVKKSKYIR